MNSEPPNGTSGPLAAPKSNEAGLVAPKSDGGGLVAPKSDGGGLVAPESDGGGGLVAPESGEAGLLAGEPGEAGLVAPESAEVPGASALPIETQNLIAQNPPAPSHQHTPRSPRGKIARLPKATRDKLNVMLRDGLKYDDIRDNLGDEAKNISSRNISNWHTSPSYERWLLERDWLENLRLDQESAFDLLDDFDAAKFNEAALQLAVTRLFLAFRHIDAGDLNQKLGGNAQSFARLVNALARASRETTNIEKYRDACAKAVAAELKQMNVDWDLNDNEYALLVNKMDQVFKVPRRRPAAAPSPDNHPTPVVASSLQPENPAPPATGNGSH